MTNQKVAPSEQKAIDEFINMKLKIKEKEKEVAKMGRELDKLKPNIRELLKKKKYLPGMKGIIAKEESTVREIDAKKFRSKVPDSTFYDCIKVLLGKAEGYMEREDLDKISTITPGTSKLHVCKDMDEFNAKMEKNKKKSAIKVSKKRTRNV